MAESTAWRDIANRKQHERQSRIPNAWLLPDGNSYHNDNNVLDVPHTCGVLTADELAITGDHDASALLIKLARGALRSVDVVTAFCKRAAIAQQLTNCLTEIMFDDAIARAQHLDHVLATTGRPVGPLHGLPVSIKDTFKVKGYDSSLGIAALCFRPATTDSALVRLLLELGAVLYVKTNVPQTLMALDSHNNVFDRVLNPANRLLTAGGSSGGEGALVALKGSPLGVGTDVGGSIRIPAMCNGLWGVKPGHGRVPYAGQESWGLEGNSRLSMEATAGPIARSMRDCEMFLRVISDSRPWTLDPDVLPQSWEQQISLLAGPSPAVSTPVIIGVAMTDGSVTPHPPISRFIDQVAELLRTSSGAAPVPIEIVELDLAPLWSRCLKLFNALQSIEGGNAVFDLLESTGEPLSPWLQNRLHRRPPKTLSVTRTQLAQKTEMQTAFLDVWTEAGGYWRTADKGHPPATNRKSDRMLDVIICPPAPHPVARIDTWNTVNYTGAWNMLDYPAGVIPVREFTKADTRGEIPDGKPLNGWDEINRGLWRDVDRNAFVGSMLSIQIVAPKLHERKLVEAMALIDRMVEPLRVRREVAHSKL